LNFCPRCEAPLTSFAFTGPGERLKAGWWLARRLTSHPVSRTVYGGILAGFGFTSVAVIFLLVQDRSVPSACWLGFFLFLDFLFLRKVHGQYEAGKHRALRSTRREQE